MTGSRRVSRITASGFTLIEVMVALLVLGIALPALLSQVLTQVEASAHLRDKTLASWVASDQLEQLRLQQRLQGVMPVGLEQGERELAERTWYWAAQVEATELPGIVRLTVNVGLHEDLQDGLQKSESLISLSAYSQPRLPPVNTTP